MEPLLFLAHRIPYPPNKGDKLRSYHELRVLAQRFRVHVGSFIDDPADEAYVAPLAAMCASSKVVRLSPRAARLRSLAALPLGDPLSCRYYASAELSSWVREVVASEGIRRAVVFSSAMAQFVSGLPRLEVVVDFVDVDSQKWTHYAAARRWPLRAVYALEARRLLAFERAVAGTARASVFVTDAEAALFGRLAPESAGCIHAVRNGVDTAYFTPDPARPTPFADGERAVVFTGAMDYWPNVDAVTWFAREVMPAVWRSAPDLRFWIVGMNPSAEVKALARDARVVVTGRVPDVRPYVQHARVAVAPLRIARGVQNKALEAMALGRPVVASAAVAAALGAQPGTEIEVAEGPAAFAAAVLDLLGPRGATLGAKAREHVLAQYDWDRNLAPLVALLGDVRELAHARDRERTVAV